MTKKIPVIENIDNPESSLFAGVQINEAGDIIIIDLRPIKDIARDSRERIKQLLLRLRSAATPQRILEISDMIGDMARRLTDYKKNRNN